MFGYVKIFKDELKIKEYNIYRAYYCGLCHELGRSHNQLVRLGLNYDLTFLAILFDSLSDKKTELCMLGCVKHVSKRKTVCSNDALRYAANMNVLLAYFKLKDDIKDNYSVKAMIEILPFLKRASVVKKKYPSIAQSVEIHLKRLAFLEKTKCDVVDKASHEFACLMSAVLSHQKKDMDRFSYQLGRFIYIADAYDDMEKDYKAKKYNPAVIQYSYKGSFTPQMLKSMSDSMYCSLADIAEEYGKLDIKKNKAILDNIIYLGMRNTADHITIERDKNNEKSI